MAFDTPEESRRRPRSGARGEYQHRSLRKRRLLETLRTCFWSVFGGDPAREAPAFASAVSIATRAPTQRASVPVSPEGSPEHLAR